MTSWGLRLYTLVVAVVCTAALAFAIHSQNVTAAWKKEVRGWKDVAESATEHDRQSVRQLHNLARRYNRLISDTRRSEAGLLRTIRDSYRREHAAIRAQQALRQALAAGVFSAAGSTGAGTVSAPSAVVGVQPPSASQPVAVPAPTPSAPPPPPTSQPS